MRDPVIIIWTILAILAGFWFRWSLRRHSRSIDSATSWHILGIVLLTSVTGITLQLTMKNSLHLVWASRVALFLIGIIQVWSLYYRSWIKRDKHNYLKDSFEPELTFTLTIAIVCSICFVMSPRLLNIPYLKLPRITPDYTVWDAPVIFILPYLIFKLGDFGSQIPYRFVEKIWFYPHELVSAEKIPWREIVRVNFVVANTLLDEYRIFGRRSHPWIEVPREAPFEKVFCLMVQERRKKQGLSIIQDVGNEYGGEPKFWWLFKVKFVIWRPSTWRRKIRYVNPFLSVAANGLRSGDTIRAWRVPADKEMLPENHPWKGQSSIDPEKTILIHR